MARKQDTKVWDELVKRINRSALKNSHVKVGVFGDITKAAAHEFGTKTIPERSFIRLTFQKNVKETRAMVAKLFQRFIEKKLSADHALKLLGEWGVKEVRDLIHGQPSEWPPLQEATIAAKGSDKALIDTGELINSITYKVER